MRQFALIFIFVFVSLPSFSQKIVREFKSEDIDSAAYISLLDEYGKNKTLPEGFEKQTLVALSYFPELKEVEIVFKLKKKSSPLMAKPDFLDVILKSPHKRKYIIIISTEPIKYLEHIKFDSLPFNAQVGVLGHELSHVSDFSQRGFFGILQIAFGNLSTSWLDRFEYNTDRKTIDHGLGWQLYDWSCAVRKRLEIGNYRGANYSPEQIDQMETENGERYMNPTTIRGILSKHALYQDIYEQADK